MPRITIGRLMLVIAGLGIYLGLVQAYTFQTVIVTQLLLLAGMVWWPSRHAPWLARWGFALSSAWLIGSLLVLFAFHPVFHRLSPVWLASLVFIPIVPGFGLAWATSQPSRGRKAVAAVAVGLVVAFAVSILQTHWPLRLAFHLSSPALNRLADRVSGGGTVRPGERAGLYFIRGGSIVGGDTMLVIDPDPGGLSAFVRKGTAMPGPRREWLEDGYDKGDRWLYLDVD
jgi:hypothetical protein